MADNVWLLNDVIPTSVGQQFATPASPSTAVYWGGPVSMSFAAGQSSQDGTAPPTGVSAVSALGLSVATGTALLNATGRTVTAAVGTVAAGGTASVMAAGLSTVAAVGTSTATGQGTGATSGVVAAASIGTAPALGGAVAAPLGVVAASTLGDVVASGTDAGVVIASPTGVSALTATGTATLSGLALTEPSGVAALSAIGQPIAYDANLVIIPSTWGVTPPPRHLTRLPTYTLHMHTTATPTAPRPTVARVGVVQTSTSANALPAGTATTSAVGVARVSADVTSEPAGSDAGLSMGAVKAFALYVKPVLRYQPITRDATAVPRGVAALAAAGVTSADMDALDRAWSALQSEDDALLLGVLL